MGLFDILELYSTPNAATPNAAPTGDVFRHFDAVAEQSRPNDLGSGIAAAIRSAATPSFAQTVSNLFGQSTPEQKAGVLNEIFRALGPAGLAGAGGGILARILGTTGGLPSPSTPITPTQATQVSPSDISTLAATAQQRDDSVVDRLGSFYAQHPTLVKSLGAAALALVMSHMSQKQRA